MTRSSPFKLFLLGTALLAACATGRMSLVADGVWHQDGVTVQVRDAAGSINNNPWTGANRLTVSYRPGATGYTVLSYRQIGPGDSVERLSTVTCPRGLVILVGDFPPPGNPSLTTSELRNSLQRGVDSNTIVSTISFPTAPSHGFVYQIDEAACPPPPAAPKMPGEDDFRENY